MIFHHFPSGRPHQIRVLDQQLRQERQAAVMPEPMTKKSGPLVGNIQEGAPQL